jgi:hypothetical protein
MEPAQPRPSCNKSAELPCFFQPLERAVRLVYLTAFRGMLAA